MPVQTKFEGIKYKNHVLELDGVNLAQIAEKVGTPCYVYSSDLMVEAYKKMVAGLQDRPHQICYAVKANSNLAVLKTLANQGCGAEVVSGGELFRALEVGIPGEKIIFDGVGKSREEIDFAIRNKILFFNVESEQELVQIDVVAKEHRKVAPIAFRINPDVNPRTHPHISTGLKKTKFGIPIKKAPEIIKAALRLKNVHLMGLSCHIGSQILQMAPFVESARKVIKLYDKAKEWTDGITHINFGGGLGITYKNERPPNLNFWTQQLAKEIGDRPLTAVFEPGRCLVGNAGILLSRVAYLKRGETDNFIILDSGMNDLSRPALYEAYHAILPVRFKKYKKLKASIVGPVCETTDILAKDRRLPNLQQGDLVAIMSCGAYASSMGSQYNSRPRPPEVLVESGKFHVVRERESLQDLIAKESLPSHLRKSTPLISVGGAL